MPEPISRRDVLKTMALQAAAALPATPQAVAAAPPPGWVTGKLTGAQALVDTLRQLGVGCVFGIPGAQENEVWDGFKARGLEYLLVTHEASAACMADGYARATGQPGVLFVVPGPGITNALTGLGEARLDSVPVVCIVGDVARGEKYRAFQVHELPNAELLRPVSKAVFVVDHVGQIPQAIRQAHALAREGEPGPASVVIPYHLFIEKHDFGSGPLAEPALPFDEAAFQRALGLLAQPKLRVGIYAGMGCMDHGPALAAVAELLQAPVATSISGKGAISECHPLSVGWGYGPQGTFTAEHAFRAVDLVLAVGVKFSEVSTGFYALPKTRHMIHVDACADNLGRVMPTDVCVHADAGVFLASLLQHADTLRRPCNGQLLSRLQLLRHEEAKANAVVHSTCGVDPMALILAMRRCSPEDAQLFVDVTASQYWAAQAFRVTRPHTFFNPTDNQSMGWSIPASLGAQRVEPGRTVMTLTGDGCFLMSAMELSTAAREGLPVKFFVLDDQAYHYMQQLQRPAYRRTTATVLARLDYAALAQALGVGYHEITGNTDLDAAVRTALCRPGPVLTRVATDYGRRRIRWIEAAKDRFTEELSAAQKARFLTRITLRTLDPTKEND